MSLTPLAQLLASWLNMYLREDKIYVRDLAEDLHDGQLLLSFLEKVTAENIRYNVGATAEKNKRTNLNLLVKFVRDRFGIVCEEGIVDGARAASTAK